MTRVGWVAAMGVVVMLTATARDVSASPAEDAFREGKGLLAAGKVSAACLKFAESQRLEPALGTLLNLADCNERQGKTATSFAQFSKLESLAKAESKSAFEEEATRRKKLLASKLSRVKLELPSNVSGAVVRINGVDVSAKLGDAIAVDPGDQTITVEAKGYTPYSRKRSVVGAGQTMIIEIALTKTTKIDKPIVKDPIEKDPIEKPKPPGDDDDDDDKDLGTGNRGLPGSDAGSGRRTLALAITGGGVAVAATGLVFGALARSAYDDRIADCERGNLCGPDGIAAIDKAKSRATIATILTAGGIAVVATGVVLYLTAPSGSSARTAVVPTVGPDYAGFAIAGAL